MASIKLSNVTKSFGAFKAVGGVDIDASEGEMVTLLGPSGCGKTTTLRMVAGLEQPTEGIIHIGEKRVYDGGNNINLPAEKRGLGMVFQSYAIWPHMTVAENVAYPLKLRGVSRANQKSMVADVLSLVGMAGMESKPATKLSGGQQQRVALARALVFEPDLLLLDEPLSNLDAKLREHMRFELKTMQRRVGLTALYVTHDQEEALTLSDRLVVMNKGLIEQIGTPQEVYQRPATRFVAEFIGKANIIELEGGVESGNDGATVNVPTFDELIRVGLPHSAMRPASIAPTGENQAPCLFIRPEQISILAANQKAEATHIVLPGRVSEHAFAGDHNEYVVALNGQTSIKVSSPQETIWPVGSDLRLSVARNDIVLYGAAS